MQKKAEVWKTSTPIQVRATYEDLGFDGKIRKRVIKGEVKCAAKFDPEELVVRAAITGDCSNWPAPYDRFKVMSAAFPSISRYGICPASVETEPIFGGSFKYVFSTRSGKGEGWQSI